MNRKKHYKPILVEIIAFMVLLLAGSCPLTGKENGNTTQVAGSIPIRQHKNKLLFIENRGQVTDAWGKLRPDVLFTSSNGSMLLFLTSTSINYQFTKTTFPDGYDTKKMMDPAQQASLKKQIQNETYRCSVSLLGADPHATISKEAKSKYVENYYTAGCLSGLLGVNSYERLVYKNVYPHIDWVIYSNGNHLEYDFLVHAGGDAGQIKLKIDDAGSTQITKDGELLIKTQLGEVREKAPLSYADGKQVKSAFKMNSDGTIGFEVANVGGKELRIDPNVAWATYYGGIYEERMWGCAADSAGNVYATGTTNSASNIALAGYQSTYNSSNGHNNAFLVKFDSSGNRLWATYYGGSGDDNAQSCTVDLQGNVYMTGQASSPGLATPGAFQTSVIGLGNLLLVKFDPSGARIWATYYGNNYDAGYSCKTDRSGNVIIAGNTWSLTGVATPGACQTTFGGGLCDGLIVKFDSSGNRLWGTYYGGNGLDYASSVNADDSNNIYVAGYTVSPDNIATSNAFQPVYGGPYDCFLVKFDSAGNRQWGTYYGGTTNDFTYSNTLAIDAAQNVYFTGHSLSSNGIASPGAYQTNMNGGYDAILAKFDPSGNRIWATYYGGYGSDEGYAVLADAIGNIYLIGATTSNNVFVTFGQNEIATPGAYQDTLYGGGNDGFLAIFDTAGNRVWSTYYGNTGYDIFYSGAVDALGNVYMAGYTNSTSGVATTGAYQTTLASVNYDDGLLVKFRNHPPLITTGSVTGSPFCAGASVSIPFTATNGFYITNKFTAQLSDTSGSFAAPVTIGTVTSAASSGAITGTVPMNVLSGTHYRIRVVSSSPVAIGTNNGSDMVINAAAGIPLFSAGTITRCANNGTTSATATASNSTGISYSLDSATAAFPGNNIAPSTGVVTFSANWSGTTIVKAIAIGCNGQTEATDTIVTIALPTEPAAFIVIDTAVCRGQLNVAYMVPNDSSVIYHWTFMGTGGSITGSGNSIQISFDTIALSGAVQVAASNTCGTSPIRSTYVTVYAKPVVSISGTASVCSGGADTLIAAGATSYIWLPAASLSASAGDTVVARPLVTTTYTAVGTSNGCSDTVSQTVNVTSILTDTIIAEHPGIICSGTTIGLGSASASSYQWQLNGTDIAGATANIYYAAVAGNYDVRVTTAQGCIITSNHIQLDSSNISIPVIVFSYDQLCVSTTYSSYQWLLNGVSIAGATTQCIKIDKGGDYKVTVTNAAGCSAISNVFYLNTGVSELAGNSIRVYPNPATDVVNITSPFPVNASLSSIDGRVLYNIKKATFVNISALPPAVYTLKIYDEANNVIDVEKVIKTDR
ncbi:MAG: SBBP repeat-containing protein [Flavipsychrobacter sp.]|nr:SBBP repeat-containing protein [Flavipsychrobacter sp.]